MCWSLVPSSVCLSKFGLHKFNSLITQHQGSQWRILDPILTHSELPHTFPNLLAYTQKSLNLRDKIWLQRSKTYICMQVFASVAKELFHKGVSQGENSASSVGKQSFQKRKYNLFSRSEEVPADPHRQVQALEFRLLKSHSRKMGYQFHILNLSEQSSQQRIKSFELCVILLSTFLW